MRLDLRGVESRLATLYRKNIYPRSLKGLVEGTTVAYNIRSVPSSNVAARFLNSDELKGRNELEPGAKIISVQRIQNQNCPGEKK